MSETSLFPETGAGYLSEVCPFLGVAEDPQTAMSFPSVGNYCHRTRPYGTPNLDFQRSFCFSEQHTNCPVFMRSGRAPLPAELSLQSAKPPVGKRLVLPILAGGIVILLGILGVYWGIQNRSKHGGVLAGQTAGTASPSMMEESLSTLPFTDTPVPPTIETATPELPAQPGASAIPSLATLQSTPTDLPFTPTVPPTIHFIPTFTPTITFIIFANTPVPPADTAVPPTAAPTAAPTEAPTATSAPIATDPPGG